MFASNQRAVGLRGRVVALQSDAYDGSYLTRYLDIKHGTIHFESYLFDIVHVHGYHRIFADLLIRRLSQQKSKIVSTLHGALQWEYLDSTFGPLPHRFLSLMKVLHDRTVCPVLLRKLQKIIAISKMEQRFLVDCLNVPLPQIAIIPNGIPDEAFNEILDHSEIADRLNNRLGFKTSEEPFLISIGRLSPGKCFHHVIKIIPSLPKEIHFVVFGTDQGELQNLQQLSRDLHVKERVHFLDTNASEKYLLLSYALALVLPSRHEGLPIVVLEAMARACPVIATTSGGQAEIINEGRVGFTYPWGDLSELSILVMKLYDDRRLAREIGQIAQRYSRGFAWTEIAERVSNLYGLVAHT